jgi:hypothetical protein
MESSFMRHLVFTALPTVTALAVLAQAGPTAAQTGDPYAVRAVGSKGFVVQSPKVNNLSIFCVTPGQNGLAPGQADCVLEASATMKVAAATQKKLKLSSATIAKGGAVAKCGEGQCLTLTASKAVRAAVKKAKRVAVTYKLTITSPITETVTQKVVMTAGGGGRLSIRSSGDTFVVSGG